MENNNVTNAEETTAVETQPTQPTPEVVSEPAPETTASPVEAPIENTEAPAEAPAENAETAPVENTETSAESGEITTSTDPITTGTAWKEGVMHERDIKKVTQKQKFGKVFVQIGLYAFLGIMALVILFPFYFMLISSVKSVKEFELSTPTLFPKQILWSNYAQAFTDGNLGRLFLNTLFVGVVSTILSLIITVLSAFAFARLEFKGKNALFAFLLATMMIPGELFTITNYQTVNVFGWMNTYTVLIVPFLVSVFYIYLLKQNFMQIPNELYLAAKVDGTTDFMYLLKVMIPLALPTLISITILKMMGSWNSYIWPRLVANKAEMRLVTNGLRALSFVDPATGRSNIPVQMAAVAMVSAPLFLVFLFLRKYIMKGVSRSGIKG